MASVKNTTIGIMSITMAIAWPNAAAGQVTDLGSISEYGRQNRQSANQAQAAGLRYTPNAALRKANYNKVIAEAKKTNPALAELYTVLATQVDLYAIVNDYLGKYGMRADDLGDVMALSWFSAYQIANGGKTDDPTRAQLTAIRTQLGSAMGELAKFSDNEKQTLADALMMDMAAQQGALEGAKESDPKLIPQLAANFTTSNNELFNVDFRQMTLTAKGLEPKAGTKAVAVKPAPAKKAALSSATNAPAGSKAKPPLAQRAVTGAPKDYSHLDRILGVRYKSDVIFMAGGPAGYLNRVETTTVLFKDGTACWDCLSGFFDDPSLSKYAKNNPKDIGKWVKRGQTYFITFPGSNGSPSEIDAGELRAPAPKGTKYNGRFETSGGMTIGGYDNYTSTSWSEDLHMFPDGRFTWAKESGIYGSGPGAIVAGGNSSPATSGKYFIDGYTIRFEFGDGKVETKSFVHFPKELDFFIIDGSAYWIPSD